MYSTPSLPKSYQANNIRQNTDQVQMDSLLDQNEFFNTRISRVGNMIRQFPMYRPEKIQTLQLGKHYHWDLKQDMADNHTAEYMIQNVQDIQCKISPSSKMWEMLAPFEPT